MAYTRRNYGKKRKVSKKRKYYKRKSATSQAKQLLSLDKRVTKLTRRVLKPTQFQLGVDDSKDGIHFPNFELSTFGSKPLVYQIIAPQLSTSGSLGSFGWKPIFETDRDSSNVTNPDNQYEYMMTGVNSRFCVEVEATNRTQPNWYQIFIVSLKGETAQQTMENTADMSAVRDGYEYTNTTTGTLEANCLWRLNPSIFNIHYNSGPKILGVHPFFGAQTASLTPELVTPGNYVTNIGDVTKSHQKYIGRKTTIIARPNTAGPVHGFMDLVAADIKHTKQLWVLAFTNAQGGVTGNRLTFSANHTIYGNTVK